MKSVPNKPLTPAIENYLEAIFNLAKEKRVVRVKDIAKRLGVKMPTVTNMLKTLSERGLIEYEKYEYLELTKKGSEVGEEIDRRHHVLRSFLTDILGIDLEKADEEARKKERLSCAMISFDQQLGEFLGTWIRFGWQDDEATINLLW